LSRGQLKAETEIVAAQDWALQQNIMQQKQTANAGYAKTLQGSTPYYTIMSNISKMIIHKKT
jgi:hypothetical protein